MVRFYCSNDAKISLKYTKETVITIRVHTEIRIV